MKLEFNKANINFKKNEFYFKLTLKLGRLKWKLINIIKNKKTNFILTILL